MNDTLLTKSRKVVPAGPVIPVSPDSARFYVVGIGSSAGALEAYQHLLPVLPVTRAAYIICQHLSPDRESMLTEILGRSSRMPVTTLESGKPLEEGHVYIIPPNRNVEFDALVPKLVPVDDRSLPKPNINLFLRALGQAFAGRAVAIILSGSGSDGAVGIQAVQASGGVALAQSPESAAYDSMPAAAIATEQVDYVGDLPGIAAYLARYFERTLGGGIADHNDDTEFQSILMHLADKTRIDLRNYRQSTIRRRLARRMAIRNVADTGAYLRLLEETPAEVNAFMQDAFIHVSSFYRDPDAFENLHRQLTGFLNAQRDLSEFRVWVPACATGEEAFTLAMLLDSVLEECGRSLPVRIFATDISARAIATARTGAYPLDRCTNLPEDWKNKYCHVHEDFLQVNTRIREQVVFSVHNVLEDPPFSRIHLVSCRNLMIYLNQTLQDDLNRLFNYVLVSQGLLFLGTAETLRDRDSFVAVDESCRIYRKVRPSYHRPTFLRFSGTRGDFGETIGHRRESAFVLETEALKAVARLYAPTVFVVDGQNSILYTLGQADLWLEPREGVTSENLVERVRSILRAELRAMMFRVRRGESTNELWTRQLEEKGEAHLLHLSVDCFHDARPDWLVVGFRLEKEVETTGEGLPASAGNAPGFSLARLALEQELMVTRENLQTVIEELESANEQLQIYNEELQSSNEEYQSTNEELQTVNEELQSTNEELVTVNDELKDRIAEQERLTADLNNIQESLNIPLFVLDPDYRIRRFTAGCSRLVDVDRLRLEDFLYAVHWHHPLPALKDWMDMALRESRTVNQQVTIHDRMYQCSISLYQTHPGQVTGLLVSFYDITEAKLAERMLSLEREIALNTVSHLSEGVIRLDEELRVEYMNSSAEELLEWDFQDVTGSEIDRYVRLLPDEPEAAPIRIAEIVKECHATSSVYSTEEQCLILTTRLGNERKVNLTVSPITSSVPGISTRALLTFKDVTQQQAHIDQLVWNSMHDSLTGLVNRKEVEARISRAIDLAQESNITSTFFYMDLDQFKVVNDTCGHLAGDQLLKQIALLIGRQVRSRDTLARLGGDEFAVLLERCPLQEAEKIAQGILQAVSRYTFSWEGKLFKIGVSIGVVSIQDNTASVASVLSEADAACYSAKEKGRNRTQVHSHRDDVLERQRSQMAVLSDINDAIENVGLRTYFQEIRPLHEGPPSYWEALVRMFNRDGEFMLPSRFLPASERFGVIHRIDQWVLSSVLGMLSQYWSAGGAPIINVNVSACTINSDSYLDTVTARLAEYGLDFSNLCFELTETAAMGNFVRTQNFVSRVRDAGGMVALDDFGTGTSSLAYLRELPVTSVKLDRMFTQTTDRDEVNETIIEAVANVAHKLNLTVVAEGVEEAAQLQRLRNLGVDYVQGYAIRRPVPMEEFVSLNQRHL